MKGWKVIPCTSFALRWSQVSREKTLSNGNIISTVLKGSHLIMSWTADPHPPEADVCSWHDRVSYFPDDRAVRIGPGAELGRKLWHKLRGRVERIQPLRHCGTHLSTSGYALSRKIDVINVLMPQLHQPSTHCLTFSFFPELNLDKYCSCICICSWFSVSSCCDIYSSHRITNYWKM